MGRQCMIGNTSQDFVTTYGEPIASEPFWRFGDDLVHAIFVDDSTGAMRSVNVAYIFERTDKPRWSKEDAWAFVNGLIPKDSLPISEIETQKLDATSYKEYQVLKSQELADLFRSTKVDDNIDPTWYTSGIFTSQIKADNDGVFGVVVGLGDRP